MCGAVVLVALMLLTAIAALSAPANEPATVVVTIVDATSGAPVAGASADLIYAFSKSGEALRATADAAGEARFNDVPAGGYELRVSALGYTPGRAERIDVTRDAGEVHVVVRLAKIATPKVIGSVQVQVRDGRGFVRSPEQALPRDLGRAFDLPRGVEAFGGNVSVLGRDPTEVGVYINGSRINAPNSAFNLGALVPDLFSLSAVDTISRGADVGGGLRYTTIYPTLDWGAEIREGVGTYGSGSSSAAVHGTAGFLGIAAQHATGIDFGPLNGLSYFDTSGLYTGHQNFSDARGDVVALQGEVGSHSIRATAVSTTRNSAITCAVIYDVVPCGIGPGNYHRDGISAVFLRDIVSVGRVPLTIEAHSTRTTSRTDEQRRMIDLLLSPYAATTAQTDVGASVTAETTVGPRHALSFDATVDRYRTQLSSTLSPALRSTTQSTAALDLGDSIRLSPRLIVRPFGGAGFGGAQSTRTLGVSALARGARAGNFQLTFSGNALSDRTTPLAQILDPYQLSFTCDASSASLRQPVGMAVGTQTSRAASASYSREWSNSGMSVQAYSQVLNNAVVTAEIPVTQFPPSILAADFFPTATRLFQSPAGCGSSAGVLDPARIFVTAPIPGARGAYQGMLASGYRKLGPAVAVSLDYSVTVAKDIFTPAATAPGSTILGGAQLPNVPLHRADATLTFATPSRALFGIYRASFVSTNNPNNLPAYVYSDAGLSAKLRTVVVTLVARNVFNTRGALFSSAHGAVPLATSAGPAFATIATPLSPRTLSISAQFDGRGFFRTAAGPSASNLAADQDDAYVSRLLSAGFPGIAPLNRRPPRDPLSIDPNRDAFSCSDEWRARLIPVFDGLKRLTAALAAGQSPEEAIAANPVPRAIVEYRRTGTTYVLFLDELDAQLHNDITNCAVLHIGSLRQARAFGLPTYRPDNSNSAFGFVDGFSPRTGFYWIKPTSFGSASEEHFRLYPEGAARPADPFVVESRCPANLRDAAHGLLEGLRSAYRASPPFGQSSSAWNFQPHDAPGQRWYALRLREQANIRVMLSCAYLTGMKHDDLTRLHIGAEPLPALNFAPAVGLYVAQ